MLCLCGEEGAGERDGSTGKEERELQSESSGKSPEIRKAWVRPRHSILVSAEGMHRICLCHVLITLGCPIGPSPVPTQTLQVVVL